MNADERKPWGSGERSGSITKAKAVILIETTKGVHRKKGVAFDIVKMTLSCGHTLIRTGSQYIPKFAKCPECQKQDEIPVCIICGKPNPPRRYRQHLTCSLTCNQIWTWRKSDKIRQRNRETIHKCHDFTRGKHGFGRMERDNPNHKAAKWWRLRSPTGEVYEIKNLASFCRKNEHLFVHEAGNESCRCPLYRRAQAGMQQAANGKCCSWKGWTAVCVFDIEKDPLDRKVV